MSAILSLLGDAARGAVLAAGPVITGALALAFCGRRHDRDRRRP